MNNFQYSYKYKDFVNLLKYYFSKERKSSSSRYPYELQKEIFNYIIKTLDGSYTLTSPDFDGKTETMHNSNGAITESFEKFIRSLKFSYILF